jgi:hypothetical protein
MKSQLQTKRSDTFNGLSKKPSNPKIFQDIQNKAISKSELVHEDHSDATA